MTRLTSITKNCFLPNEFFSKLFALFRSMPVASWQLLLDTGLNEFGARQEGAGGRGRGG